MGKKETRNRAAYLEALVESIGYRSQLIARSQKLDSGILATRRIGFAAGFVTAVVFVFILPILVWKGMGII